MSDGIGFFLCLYKIYCREERCLLFFPAFPLSDILPAAYQIPHDCLSTLAGQPAGAGEEGGHEIREIAQPQR